jgi:hypothetical protein
LFVPLINVILSDKEHDTLVKVCLHQNRFKTDDIFMSNWMLMPPADISLKASIEMMFGQGTLGRFYSFVK